MGVLFINLCLSLPLFWELLVVIIVTDGKWRGINRKENYKVILILKLIVGTAATSFSFKLPMTLLFENLYDPLSIYVPNAAKESFYLPIREYTFR